MGVSFSVRFRGSRIKTLWDVTATAPLGVQLFPRARALSPFLKIIPVKSHNPLPPVRAYSTHTWNPPRNPTQPLKIKWPNHLPSKLQPPNSSPSPAHQERGEPLHKIRALPKCHSPKRESREDPPALPVPPKSSPVKREEDSPAKAPALHNRGIFCGIPRTIPKRGAPKQIPLP